MATSIRVLSGSLTKGSTAIDITPGESTIDGFRDGIYLKDYHDVLDTFRRHIRPNTSDIITLGGKTISELAFNDQMTPIAFNTGSSVQIGTIGRFRSYLNHSIEQRDLGQSELYDDGSPFVESTNPDKGAEIIAVHPLALELPASLVDHASVSAMDGKIEPLLARSSIDRSSIDHPYTARGVKASMGVGIDAFKRSFIVEDGVPLPGIDGGTEPFLDSVETFGFISGTDMPGAFYADPTKVTPFKDFANDREKFFTDFQLTSGSNDI